jgi:DNA adenine methylase
MLSQLPKLAPPRPFLKWAGGKSKLIQQYKQYLPNIHDYKTYHEPFLGGGALFFYLLPTKAVLTDINSELITTYLCVRDKLEELLGTLKLHEFYHNRDYYYKVRGNPGSTDVEKAARLIYLNRTCFNGLYRVNSKGEFNVPLGKYDNPKICQLDILVAASEALQSSVIEELDFSHVLKQATSADDFVFFDPPYHPISQTSYFTAYSKLSFNQLDQIRLRDISSKLALRGVKVMVCNSDCEFIRSIYNEIDFKIHLVKATRVINSNIKNRGSIGELVITSY